MRLRVETDADVVLTTLAACPNAIWTVLGMEKADSRDLANIDRQFGEREISASLSDPEREAAGSLAKEFFRQAVEADPAISLNFSARVPLAISGWDEIQRVFQLRVLAQRSGPTELVVWLTDSYWRVLLYCAGLEDKSTLGFKGSGALFRQGRALLRCLVQTYPRLANCNRLWFSIGGAVAVGSVDTYFGDWIRQAPDCNFRVYMSPGRVVRLAADDGQAPLEAFASVSDVLAAWSASRQRPVPAKPFVSKCDRRLWDFLASREIADGGRFALAFQRLAFARMLARVKPRSIVIPFEFRAWERVLAGAARVLGIDIVGYQHSSLTPRHLCLLDPAADWRPGVLPDRIVSCGEITAERLQPLAGTVQIRVLAGAALRTAQWQLPPPGRAILVAISSSRGEALALIRAVARVAAQLARPIIIRPHPAIPVDDLFRQFVWPEGVELSCNRTLEEDMAQVGFVVYSSSTVALEGMQHGRLPVFLDIGDVLSGDPIGDGEFKLRADDAWALAAQIAEVDDWPAERVTRMREAGRAYALRYLVPPTSSSTAVMTNALTP